MYDVLSRMYEGRNINRKMNLRAQLKGTSLSHNHHTSLSHIFLFIPYKAPIFFHYVFSFSHCYLHICLKCFITTFIILVHSLCCFNPLHFHSRVYCGQKHANECPHLSQHLFFHFAQLCYVCLEHSCMPCNTRFNHCIMK